jgi:large subunit ribosomal protein L4
MSKANVYSVKGVRGQAITLPKNFSEKENKILLAQAIRVYENRLHPGLSKTKRRGEVIATTRKVWRQKGTGRARHGARSAPIFVGGGKAHGPTGTKRQLVLPKKMRQKSLNIALSMKAKNGQVIVVDNTSSLKKTKEAQSLIDKIISKEKKMKKGQRFTFVLTDGNLQARLALRNIKKVGVIDYKNLNAYQVFFGEVLIFDKDIFDTKKGSKKK